jgi:tyrosyl-tRNA synthetase
VDVLRILNDRGLVYQLTDEEQLSEALSGDRLPFYIGFDATAPSLHLGHLVPLMAASWLQKSGHRPLIVVGGATALVGDPSGRSAERTLEARETIGDWARSISAQFRRFLDFGPSGALLMDNSGWLLGLDYIGFLRDIGSHFSVNRMLTADSVRTRLEKGLSFLEFNYMLLQAYDFLWLYRNQGCRLQIGGADQWGNIIAGIELIRRVEAAEAWGMTCPLVTGSGGEKMSKTMPGGAVWLDPCLTSPYEYYQFWINVDDRDAIHFLKLYTFVPMDEIEKLVSFRGEDIRAVKKRLAWEATAIAHGIEEAERAEAASAALFSGVGDAGAAPSMEMPRARLDEGITWTDLFVETGLCPSRSDVRRLAQQNGLYVGEQRITTPDDRVHAVSGQGAEFVLRAGKKRYFRVVFG